MNAKLPDDKSIAQMLGEAARAFPPAERVREDIRHTLMAERQRRGGARPARPARWPLIGKIAAGGVVVCLAAVVSLFLLGDRATVSAHAELIAALENSQSTEWTHMRGSVNGEEIEIWYGTRPFHAFVVQGGRVEGRDLTCHYAYDPDRGTITIENVAEHENPDFLEDNSFYEIMLACIDLARGTGAEVSRGREVLDGKPCTVFTIRDRKGIENRIVVDPEAHRIAAMETEVEGERLVLRADYPATGPADVYELGVPADARIVDRRVPESPPDVKAENQYSRHFNRAMAVVDGREHWPSTPKEVAEAYWNARNARQYDEMEILWPGSLNWPQMLKEEQPVEYVFGEAREHPQLSGVIVVPYTTRDHYQTHGIYSWQMLLTNRESSRGRYYIISGN